MNHQLPANLLTPTAVPRTSDTSLPTRTHTHAPLPTHTYKCPITHTHLQMPRYPHALTHEGPTSQDCHEEEGTADAGTRTGLEKGQI